MNEYFPTVVQVIPLDNFHVQVFFDDGKIVDYDATEDLKAEIFKPLRDIDAFKEACTVMRMVLLHGIFLATEMNPVVLTLIHLLYMS